MSLQKLQFNPGIIRDQTREAGQGAWFDCDKVRFRNGMPEKIGGWSKLTTDAYSGTCRALFNWVVLDGTNYMAVGTSDRYYLENGGSLNNITPYRTANITLGANPLKTGAAGSGEITVTDVAHGALNGTYVVISGAATVDGVTDVQINQEHKITLIDANSYKITTSGSASSGSTAGGGSSVVVRYEINAGNESTVSSTGWGAGFFGGISTSYSENTLSSGVDDSVTTIPLTSASDFEVASTTLSSAVAVTDVTISLASVSGIPDRGTILVDSERILYGSRDTSANTISDITRGFDGTTNAAHSSGAFVGLVLIGTELITYTAKSGNSLTSAVRGVRGTTAAAHDSGDAVKEANDFTGFGSPSLAIVQGQALRLWSQDNYGEDLLFNARDLGVFYWDRTTGITAHGINISDISGSSGAPTVSRQIMVSNNDRHVIAFGCNAIGETLQDKLLIRWADQESLIDWTPTTTNTAGDLRLNSGSEIVAAFETRQEILVWTDSSLNSMRYVGPPFTFGQSLIASATTIMSPRSIATINDATFWMGFDNFYMYNGRVQTIPCQVRSFVFEDINFERRLKVFAGTIAQFNEVIWFYPSESASEPDKYVIYNMEESVWYFGSLSRTAWVDRTVRNYPIAANPGDDNLYYHELGLDDGSTSPPTGITAYVESADFELGDGDSFQFIRKIIPDLSFFGSTESAPVASMTLKPRNFPGEAYGTSGTGTVTASQTVDVEQFTSEAFVRLGGRAMAFGVESTGVGRHWRLGAPRIEVRADGRR